jgi:aminopeptidase
VRGAEPFLQVELPGYDEIYYKFASEEVIKRTPDIPLFIAENFDASILVWTEDNTRALTNVDPKLVQAATRAKQPISKISLDRSAPWTGTPYYEDPPPGSYRWCVTLWPTAASAMEANMGTGEFSEFVFRSVGAFEENPIKFWEKQAAKQEKYVDLLNKVDHMRFTGPNCDIEFRVGGRKWINCDGRFNMPDGEVFTAPHENYTQGWVNFTAPTLHGGRVIENVKVQMLQGKCVHAEAADQAQTDYVNQMLDSDPDGESRILGELAFGLNPNITTPTKEILFDEKIAGTFHMAFGKGYPESGSQNDQASLHWDMICDMSEGLVYADGKLIYENGAFLL